MPGSSSSSRASRVMEAAIPRRGFAKATSIAVADESQNQESSGPGSRRTSDPPTYDDVPSVHPPVYVDNEAVPGYGHHRRDQLLASCPMLIEDSESDSDSLGGYTLRQLDITPPHNNVWIENGWDSEAELDDSLNDNLSYLRQVLDYLRANWDTPINGDIEDVARAARSTYRNLTRQITRYYEKWQDRELAMIDAKHQIFQNQQHNLWERNIEFLSNQHQKFAARHKIKLARVSRTNTLDEAIYKIQSQHRSIYFRSAGLAQV